MCAQTIKEKTFMDFLPKVVPDQGRIDNYIFVCGQKRSGKTSLLNVLQGIQHEEPKPTVGLDYVYARRARPGNAKEVANIFEAGECVDEYLPIVAKPERLKEKRVLLMIVVDLSVPTDAIAEVMTWFEAFRMHLKEERPPVLICGNKFDLYKNENSRHKKALAQALRYAAHYNKASLVFTSCREEASSYRSILGQFLFFVQQKKSKSQVDHEKPLYILEGTDDPQAISEAGPLSLRHSQSTYRLSDDETDALLSAVSDFFSVQPTPYILNRLNAKRTGIPFDYTDPDDLTFTEEFADEEIDQVFKQKMQAIEDYRKKKEQVAREKKKAKEEEEEKKLRQKKLAASKKKASSTLKSRASASRQTHAKKEHSLPSEAKSESKQSLPLSTAADSKKKSADTNSSKEDDGDEKAAAK